MWQKNNPHKFDMVGDVLPFLGKSCPGAKLGLGHRLHGGEHRRAGSDGWETSSGAGIILADYQSGPLC